MALYNKIGRSYDTTRRADPYIVQRLLYYLNFRTEKNYLDVACGSGNYTIALANAGVKMYGIDQSTLMIETAKTKSEKVIWSVGEAEYMPYQSETFSGAICTLAIHHFNDLLRPFQEIYRCMKEGNFVIFTSTPNQMEGYWLNEYFPEALKKSIQQMPTLSNIINSLENAGFNSTSQEIYTVRPDLQDWFLYSGKYRPEIYLDPVVRAGISTFANIADQEEVQRGVKRLAADIESGKISKVISSYNNNQGDYIFVVAKKGV